MLGTQNIRQNVLLGLSTVDTVLPGSVTEFCKYTLFFSIDTFLKQLRTIQIRFSEHDV